MTDDQLIHLVSMIERGGRSEPDLIWLIPLIVAVATSSSWLFQILFRNRLQRDLEKHKAVLSENLQRTLSSEASQQKYEDEARRRLYHSIGPLRFQLLLACRDTVSRIARVASSQSYTINVEGYFGRSTIYRILRTVAICDLIEDRVSVADFSVDADAIDCLRLRRAFQKALSGNETIGSLPGVNWNKQIEHVFADRISGAASLLICDRESGKLLRYDEFEALLNDKGSHLIAPFDGLFSEFTPQEKPIFWTRLTAFAVAADRYLGRHGPSVGFDYNPLNVRELLVASNFREILSRLEELTEASEEVAKTGI